MSTLSDTRLAATQARKEAQRILSAYRAAVEPHLRSADRNPKIEALEAKVESLLQAERDCGAR